MRKTVLLLLMSFMALGAFAQDPGATERMQETLPGRLKIMQRLLRISRSICRS